MPKPNTSIEIKGIASVLSSTKLEVPVHQRSFEWTEEVSEFLEDVGGAFSRNKEEYYLGSLVIISETEGERPKLLDGQQRLAVASLLLAGIADQLAGMGDQKRAQAIRNRYLTTFDITEGVERPQLKLNQADDPFFRLILTGDAQEPTVAAPDSHRRLWEARQAIASWLTKRTVGIKDPVIFLSEFTTYLSEAAYVIYFTVADDANAYLIFETMNDRGLDLSIADLLKNYLLGRSGEDLQAILNLWTTAIASLGTYGGENLFVTFLRHYWSSRFGLAREKELYRSIKSRVTTTANVMDFAKEIEKNSYLYAAILSPEHEFWSESPPDARENIRTLDLLGLVQYRPMLLSALAHFPLEEIQKIVSLLINWNVRMLIVGGLGGGTVEEHYCELGTMIRNGDLKSVANVASKAEDFVPNDTVFRDAFAVARVAKANLSRYYLRELENQVRKALPEVIPNPDPNKLTLEHILPEKPVDGAWSLFTEEQAKGYTKRLGNMALLSQRINSKLRSGPFEQKRPVYEKSDLLLTKGIAEAKKWTIDDIDKRQKYLAELAVKTWKLKL